MAQGLHMPFTNWPLQGGSRTLCDAFRSRDILNRSSVRQSGGEMFWCKLAVEAFCRCCNLKAGLLWMSSVFLLGYI